MSNRLKAVMNWSSGKDSALAYFGILQQPEYEITHLLTTLNEEHERVFMHGIREELLDMQAKRMSVPLLKLKIPASPSDTLYQQAMLRTMTDLRKQGVSVAIFGDIFLEDLKVYREQQLSKVKMSAIFPLWKKDTRELVRMIEESGIEAIVVCVNEKYLGKEFLGKKINVDFLNSLPANVDPCGENGEFHTFVYNAPFFSSPIAIVTGEIVHRTYTSPNGGDTTSKDTGFYFLDVDLAK